MREHISRQKTTTTGFSIPSLKHPTPSFGLESSAISRQAVPEIQPLHQPVTHDISRIPLRSQAKLPISQPGDIYEQEADSVAQQVMQRMAQPGNRQSIQREALPEDEEELQMKSLDNRTLQREALPEDEEELQMKPMVQRQAKAGMDAAPDLEASINQARGGGVVIADNIREPMEVAFGADFSGVKVHTDGQSDRLNQSIQARAFTTGQDVFFRSGEYNPGSRGGQELLAHELTHVVQQNGRAVQRSPLSPQQPAIETPSPSEGDRVIQRAKLNIRKDGTGTISGVSEFSSRSTSNIRGSQGQHLTAYVVFEDMISNRVTDRTVGEAAAELVKVLEEISELPGMKLKSAEYLKLPLMTNIDLLKSDDITALDIGIVIDNILSIRNKVPGTAERGTGGGHGEANHSGIMQEVEKALRTDKWKESWDEDIVSNQVCYGVWRLLDYNPTNPTSQEDRITIANKIVTHYKSIMSAYPLTDKWLNEREDYFQTYLEGHRDDVEMPLKQVDSSNLEQVFNLVASGL
ncbi:DUF4157 domain-containing protein [Nostoc sp. LEGE 12450]|uniref:eCIS core domain-containing protein n=1 Tax=Nostoc sp. LEGE 12450 TaxID=1828643 RepID=UPI00187FA878|nr:DUF4157 domain-containing protein [Nostoc sp. LEGE 12450]MBE8991329.1 DUF4157 domain-containing protein [Nostoc sp. LEGE 12450]